MSRWTGHVSEWRGRLEASVALRTFDATTFGQIIVREIDVTTAGIRSRAVVGGIS